MGQIKQDREILIIAGPTAVGKTSLAIKLAKLIDGEIINADSRQIYKGMDIGTNKGLQKPTKAKIQTLKAEIAAQVAAGKMSLAVAYGEVEGKAKVADQYAYVAGQWGKSSNYVIGTTNNAGNALVGFGNNVHNMIQGIATGTAHAVASGAKEAIDETGKIDYSKITSPAIAELEAQLGQLEGLYSTLMNNMGSFASYYGDSSSAVSSATSAEEERVNTLREQIDLINKEIEYRNKLNKSIEDMQTSVYNSFNKLLGRDIPKIVDNMYSAINNKDYSKVPELFNEYASNLQDSAKSKEEYLRGIISVNADIQRIPHQEQMSLLDANLATEANTREIARIQRIAAGLQKDTLKSNEKENKLDRNIELLEELIELQKEANAQNTEALEIQKEVQRDSVAAEYRARYAQGVA